MHLHRCRPLLGTLVEIRVEGLREHAAHAAIQAAFDEIASVQRHMSFHSADSDLAHLHRAQPGTAVAVDARTLDVLRCAQRFAQMSGGIFDVSVAAHLVRAGILPRPVTRFEPVPSAHWRDIELLPPDRVRLRRALWLDLGGIAKGYAVDRAIAVLQSHGVRQACVNAGGDLRVYGARAELVHLRADERIGAAPDLELRDAAIATSTSDPRAHAHLNGITRRAARSATVSVIAPDCMSADALTKIVLAGDAQVSAHALAACGAQARVHDARRGWLPLEQAA